MPTEKENSIKAIELMRKNAHDFVDKIHDLMIKNLENENVIPDINNIILLHLRPPNTQFETLLLTNQ